MEHSGAEKLSLEFDYNFKEYFEGVKWASPIMRILTIFPRILLALLALAVLLNFFLDATGKNPARLLLYVPVAIILALWGWLPYLQARVSWKGNPNIQDRLRVDVDPATVRIQTTYSDTINKWPNYLRFRETPTLFLLFYTKQSFLMIPKRAFAGEPQINAFRKLCKAKIPGSESRKV